MSKSINDNFLMKIQKTTDLKPDNISKNKFTDILLSYLVLPDKTVKNLIQEDMHIIKDIQKY